MKITVERLVPYTFHTWTDGPKVLLDTMCVGIPSSADLTIYSCAPEDMEGIVDMFSEIATVYVVAMIREFLDLVEKFPTRDLRLLVVG